MSERKYLHNLVETYWRYWVFALAVGLVVGAAAVSRLRPTYDGVTTFSLTKPTQTRPDQGAFYTYDGYYIEQTAILARNNLVAWMKSPSTISQVYEQAKITPPNLTIKNSSQIVMSKDTGANNSLIVALRSDNPDKAKALVSALVEIVKRQYQPLVAVEVTATDPLMLTNAPPRTVTFIGVAMGVVFAVFSITVLTHYFRSEI